MIYTIKKGDTLSKIAKQFGTTVTDIQKANSSIIKDVNKIQVGCTITIPTKTTTTMNNYADIGRLVVLALKEIENLDSVKKLKKLV